MSAISDEYDSDDYQNIMHALKPRRKSKPPPPSLPIFALLSHHLIAQNLHSTCASLAGTCKAIKVEVTPVLWRRVVFRWNNSVNAKKKSAAKWRTVFESASAKYIQYLVAIPSQQPDISIPTSPWDPPFLPSILGKKGHELKACIVVGQGDQLGVSLFEGYRAAKGDVGGLVDTMRVVQESEAGRWETVVVRLCADDVKDRRAATTQDLQNAVARNKSILDDAPPLPTPIMDLRLILTFTNPSSEPHPYLAPVMVDLISAQDASVVKVLNGDSARREERMDLRTVTCNVEGVRYEQALAMAPALNAAFLSNPLFAGIRYTFRTRYALTAQQAHAFLRAIQHTYLLTSPSFRHRQPGTICILDGSGKNPPPGVQARKKLVGILEYWWRGKATSREFEAARMVGFVGDKFMDAVTLRMGRADGEESAESAESADEDE